MGPRVHLYTLCWDEADMLGFFFRHYEPWVERFVVFDDGSTDGSRDILRAHPKVELRTFERTDAASFCLSQQSVQDQCWKESRGQADWVVITAIDEHLHVRGRDMGAYLGEQKSRGVTLLPALGFDMNHPTMPADEGILVERVTRGRPRIAFNKLSIFDPDAVHDSGFSAGRHRADPSGHLVLPARNEVMLWHYKHLGFERNAEREATQNARLGAGDRTRGLASHYSWSRQTLRAFWDQMERESIDLAAEDVVPDRACVGPLWWADRKDIMRAPSTDELRPKTTPKVSVLVKSFNHAAYVAQTIESLLAQSFQDFEIVVTDDASSDGTVDVIKRFDDPRIKLAVTDRNLGIPGAMNATIARARGDYLAILNSDDWALPDRLKDQVEFLDANPHVGVVAGLPRPVDERGDPTNAYNDFRAPLSFPDFSRRTWLRYFLNHGNCICAPTAMIRREVFDDVGTYDRRLTNLQDFDMWIRILLAGHTIHIMPDELTAFRIRESNANMSAVRPDSVIRSSFEMHRVMRHYQTISADDFEVLFGDLAADTAGQPLQRRLALLALQHVQPSARLAGLECLADTADDDDAFDLLRELTGVHDVFAAEAVRQFAVSRDQVLQELEKRLRDETATIEEARNQARRDAEGLRREIMSLHLVRDQAWQDAEKLRSENEQLHARLQDTFGHRVRKRVEKLWYGKSFGG